MSSQTFEISFHQRKPVLSGLVLSTILTPLFLMPSFTASAAEVRVEEIIVTAQRRAEKLENVPMSVAAVSAELAEKSGAQGVLDLGAAAAGVMVAFNGTSMQPAVRGVTTLSNGPGFENNVAIYLDGIYQGETTAINMDLSNISDVQVLKGPQGALYGRNATGGAILINTLPPSKVWTGKFNVSYARFNEKTFSGYLSGPINDRVRFGISGYIRTNDGYFKMSDPVTGLKSDRDAAPYKTADVRAKLQADVTDDLQVTVGYNYSYVNDLRNFLFTQSSAISPALPQPPARPLIQPDYYTKAYNSSIKNFEITNEATLKADWKTSFGSVTAIGAYTNRKMKEYFDTDGTYADLAFIRAKLYFSTYQASVFTNITAIKNLDLLVGGDYYHDFRETRPNYTTAGGNPIQISYNQQRSRSYAFYADATYHIGRFALNAGGRYAHDDAYINFQVYGPTGTVITAANPRFVAFKKFIPRASVRYELGPDTNVYASFSRGYKPGGWPYGQPPLKSIGPETISAYEVGFKTAQEKFRFNAAAFYYDFKDLQISIAVLNPLCNPAVQICSTVPLLLNGPKSEIYGVDGQFVFNPTERLTLRLGGAWVHARYKDFANAVGTGFNAATGLNVLNQTQNMTGQQMARAPTFSGSAGFDYAVPTSVGDVTLTSNLTYSGSYVVGNLSLYGPLAGAALANKQRFRTGPYALLNAQISWTDVSGHFSLSVYGRNLTDKLYWQFYQGNANGNYPIAATPRVVGVKAGYQF